MRSNKGERQDSQKSSNVSFYRLPLVSAQCFIGIEKHPDNSILINYDDDDYSQGNGQSEKAFKVLTKNDILQPYISDNDFRSFSNDNDLGYNLYVLDIRYQKNLESAKPIEVKFKFSEIVPAGMYGYALVVTKNISFHKH